ncbi:hypothetical protein SDRG_04780 [Saprolegnia diclina VS20]|uniref:C2H2-type domain-containing protein n=1 Tax=Saprolegnia diclina (strain VS20) TaxID=1156394 RepID=T0RYR8_SAPDV|nr:hypothetical protein SDRG_04780 [Saprolegnia diclina VS20]EQC37753.1 hypothetical protein SDRG_04780 [Saprolegnia diclina VS20]|eukprot:XP_008608686.1 hypothetical protein SDRG_04780 [Saprolegnia diclina VS20]
MAHDDDLPAEDVARIEDAVKAAIAQTLGWSYVDAYTTSRNRLRPGRRRTSFGDLELPFAIDVFKRHIRAQCVQKLPKAALYVTTVSDYGLTRHFAYATSKAVADALRQVLLLDTSLAGLLSNLVCDAKGVLTFTTQRHFAWHSTHGRLVCSACGYFFNGQRGLRIHQVTQHGIAYDRAQSEALSSDTQLVVYVPTNDGVAHGRRAKASPVATDPGLEAAKLGDLDLLQSLVATGWDPQKVVDRHGSNTLAWAAGGNHLDVCKYLVETCHLSASALQGKPGMKRNALHWAARNGHVAITAWLLETQQVSVDAPTEDGTTAFHFAVWNSQVHMCRWLVTNGKCNVHALNAYGCNASQWSALTGSVEMLSLLQDVGVDLGVINYNGHSALHKAALRGHQDACVWLLSHGGLGRRHMRPDSDGFTPMTFASTNGFPTLGTYLADWFEMAL